MDLTSVQSIGQQLASGSISSVELTQHYLDRIEKHDSAIGSFLHVDRDGALAEAKRVDEKRSSGQPLGPLAGVPISIKDNLSTRTLPTTCASKMLENFKSPFDADVIERLVKSDAVLIGKTNLDEFAMGGSTETGYFGTSKNPWDTSKTCGGSSGGSAASVAAGFAAVSLGSDTGGSIRQPAAYCGVCGLKPTYGRVSRYGLVAFASSLDQVGPFGQTVEDLAIVLDTIAGHDARDSTSLNVPTEHYYQELLQAQSSQPKFKIGIVREHLDSPGLDPEIKAGLESAIETYQKMGYEIVPVEMPHHRYAIATYYIVAPSEASSNLSRFDGAHYGFRADYAAALASSKENPLVSMYKKSRSEGFGAEVKRRIMLGTYTLSAGYYEAYYLKSLQVRRLIRNDYDSVFEQVDALLGPTTPTPAFGLGEKSDDPVQMYLEDLFTVSANLAGVPALSIPVGVSSTGMPLGMQLQAAPLAESKLLQIAQAYHREVGYVPRVATL